MRSFARMCARLCPLGGVCRVRQAVPVGVSSFRVWLPKYRVRPSVGVVRAPAVGSLVTFAFAPASVLCRTGGAHTRCAVTSELLRHEQHLAVRDMHGAVCPICKQVGQGPGLQAVASACRSWASATGDSRNGIAGVVCRLLACTVDDFVALNRRSWSGQQTCSRPVPKCQSKHLAHRFTSCRPHRSLRQEVHGCFLDAPPRQGRAWDTLLKVFTWARWHSNIGWFF